MAGRDVTCNCALPGDCDGSCLDVPATPERPPCQHLRAEEVVVAPRLVAAGLLEREIVACVCPDCPAVLPPGFVHDRDVRAYRRYVERLRAAVRRATCDHAHVDEIEARSLDGAVQVLHRSCADCGAEM